MISPHFYPFGVSIRCFLRSFFLQLILIAFFVSTVEAQSYFRSMPPSSPYESDILSARPIRYFIAIGGGVLAFQHLGDFSPNCDCFFSGEKGMRALFAAEFSVQYPKLGFAFKGQISYQDVSATFSRKTSRMSVVVGDNPDVLVDYENSSKVELTYLALATSFAWYFPYTQIFLAGGLEFGIPRIHSFDHIEKILTADRYYYDGSTTNTLLPKEDIPGSSHLRIGLNIGVGVDIIITSRFYITPEIGATYPFTTVTTVNDPLRVTHRDWKVLTERAIIFFKYRI